jgi:hypothetical protein
MTLKLIVWIRGQTFQFAMSAAEEVSFRITA